MKTLASSLHFLKNVGCLSRPDERFGIVVVGVDVLSDGTGDIAHALKNPAPEAVNREIAEEAFDHVKPRGTCRCEMDMESRIPLEPSFDLFVLMGGIVVANDMDVLFLGNIAADQVEEANPFLVAVLFHTGADDLATERIHRGEQRGCSIAFVVVGHCLAAASLEWEPWLSSIQGLDLTFLIAGKNQRMFWWVEIKPDDVFEFFLKPLIVGKLEACHPMRLQTVRRPDAPDAGLADARGLRHGGSTPVCGSRRQIVESHLHNARTGRGCNRRDASRTGLIFENARKPCLSVAVPPSPHLHDIFTQTICNLFVLESVSSEKHYGRSLLGTNRRGSSPLDGFQLFTLLHAQIDDWGYSHPRKVTENL